MGAQQARDAADLALSVCVDTRDVTWRHTDGSEEAGALVRRSVYFARIDGSWRIVYMAYDRVRSC